METNGLDHVVVAVSEIEEARARYLKVFGADCVGPVIEAEAYRRCLVQLGGQRVELCQPVATDDPTESQASAAFARTISSRGEGLHSIAIRVRDLPAAAAELESAGVPIVTSSFSSSFFVHPKALNGVIVQLLAESELSEEEGGPRS